MTLNMFHACAVPRSDKFEVGQVILCWLITFLLLTRYVTLWPWLLILWPSAL